MRPGDASTAASGRKRCRPSPQRTSKPSTRSPSASRITSTARPSPTPRTSTGRRSSSSPGTPAITSIVPDTLLGEPLGAEQRHEPARDGPQDGGALGAADDELEPLRAAATDRDDD